MEQKPNIQPKHENEENEEKVVLGPEDVNLKDMETIQPENEKIFTPLGKGGRIVRGPFGSF